MSTTTPQPAPPALPAGCPGDCEDGTRECTCARAVIGMWDDEMREPLRYAKLYSGAFLLALLASHLFAIWSRA